MSLKLKIDLRNSTFIILILGYLTLLIPSINEKLVGKIENYILPVILSISVLFFVVSLNKKKLLFNPLLKTLTVLWLLVLFNSHTFQLKPLVFFTYLLLITISAFNLNFRKKYSMFLTIIIRLFCLINLFLVLSDQFYFLGDRFMGFLQSPTILATISLCLIPIVIEIERSKFGRFLLIGTLSMFILLSGTRLNIGVLFIFPFIYIYKEIILKYFKSLFVIFCLGLIMVYPLYGIVSNSSYGENLNRYDQEDKSFALRSALSLEIFTSLVKADYIKIILGHGSESSRKHIESTWGKDLQVHNDFLRIIYDFGIAGLILLLLVIYYYAKKGIFCFMISLVYLVAFYHNMVYSFFLISTLAMLKSQYK